MQQKFSDEFNGTSLNQNVWYVELCANSLSNPEGEPDNIAVSNGTLKLTARYSPNNIDNNCWDGTHNVTNYTVACVWSRWYPYRFKYGNFEARCFMPAGNHFNYAYWLWGPGGDGYPQDGFTSEIDIAEGCEWEDGSHHNMKSTFHLFPQPGDEISLPDDTSHGYGTSYEGSWRIYKILWSPYEVIFYIDNNEVWRRSRYYTGSDTEGNDVGMNQIVPNVLYKDRNWFPNDEMATMFQMLITDYINSSSLPATMEVDYVRVKQFFLAPEITCPDVICSTGSGTITLDVDQQATNITWQVSPSQLVTNSSGSGLTANLTAAPGASGEATITFSFQMPSGETFTAEKTFWVGIPPLPEVTSDNVYPYVWTTGYGEPAAKKYTILTEQDIVVYDGNLDTYGGLIESFDWTWYLDDMGLFYDEYDHGTGGKMYIFHEPGLFRVRATSTNNCGSTSISNPIYIDVIQDEYWLSLSPNPSSGETTMELKSKKKDKPDKEVEWDLEVFDQVQSLKAKKDKIRSNTYKLNTSGWREGIYIIRAKVKNKILTEKLMVTD
ncbi:MAG: family 16 glycosylhydrolase [Prolixibacteraceae bacterium]|jgi:hypothetical protein|nr:family 16 glycosylhydrolase [Prolixibacteraceae bacterium]